MPKLEEGAGKNDKVSLASSSSGDSASATLMSSHAMKMGLYSINLGTKFGQRMHAAHMLILPLIPVFILLAQNGTNYATFILQAEEIVSVQNQVSKFNNIQLTSLVWVLAQWMSLIKGERRCWLVNFGSEIARRAFSRGSKHLFEAKCHWRSPKSSKLGHQRCGHSKIHIISGYRSLWCIKYYELPCWLKKLFEFRLSTPRIQFFRVWPHGQTLFG